jgi:hypothetical protein
MPWIGAVRFRKEVWGSVGGCWLALERFSGPIGVFRTDSGRDQAGASLAQRRRLKAMAAISTWAEALARPT